tara:strand:- start:368 stop:754 length:387 start_codon:yes stop_codon:yes gene_type:complete
VTAINTKIYEKNKYKATILRWLDGDTVELLLDLGLRVHVESKFRLGRLNAPETKMYRGVTLEEKERGLALTDLLKNKVPEETEVLVTVTKKGKYGRYIIELWFDDEHGELTNLNDWLLNQGLVKEARY